MKLKYKYNIILTGLIVGAIFNDFVLRALTMGITLYWKPIVASIPIIILGSILGLIFSHKKSNFIFMGMSIIYGTISSLNYLYFKHYQSFLSISLLKQVKQLKELGNSFQNLRFKSVHIFYSHSFIISRD